MEKLMRTLFLTIALVSLGIFLNGCGKPGGPRFWWDDRNQERLSDAYRLPEDPTASADYIGYEEERALASGEDLSEDDLRNYHTNLDQEEEKRKSESSLFDF